MIVVVKCECGRQHQVAIDLEQINKGSFPLDTPYLQRFVSKESKTETEQTTIDVLDSDRSTTANVIDITKRLKTRKRIDDANFRDKFWPAYPRKVAKQAALRAWAAQKIATQDELDRVMAGLRRHIAQVWPGIDPKFIPHPASWLNGRRWEDEGATALPTQEKPRRNQFLEDMRAAKKWAEEHPEEVAK